MGQITKCQCTTCDDYAARGEERAEVCHESHACPYQIEINDDSEFECTCCANKEQECRWDI